MRLINENRMIEELNEFVKSDIATDEDKETAGRIATYVETVAQVQPVDVVSWKDFRDFLDDNAEDFDCIDKRLKDIEERLLDAFEQITVTKMMERWESLARKAEALENRLNVVENVIRTYDYESNTLDEWQSATEDNIKRLEDRLNAIEEKIAGYVFE